jgi:hypothetical protein
VTRATYLSIISMIIITSISAVSFASNEGNAYLGVGQLGAKSSSCGLSECSINSHFLEAGYDLDKNISIEGKFGSGNSSYGWGDADLNFGFVGVNAGSNFNTPRHRFYGKAGYAVIIETFEGPVTNVVTGFTAGVGARFAITGEDEGMFIKVEFMGVSFQNGVIAVGYIGGIGYRF